MIFLSNKQKAFMRTLAYLFALGLIAGCSTPPKPPECSGEFRPVNKIEQKGAALSVSSKLALCGNKENHEQG